MKNDHNGKKVQGFTENLFVNVIGCKCETCESFRGAKKPSEAEMEAADKLINQLADIIVSVKGRA